ncbi:hypothetical protein UPYG_G00340950 [Umbra pygmaea]|uniref:Phostensin/Taperin PP1-binding domain-containing protein n=1 Tax=Umbra pygmaea TaxID=75934 RepID=A0ABD0W1B9_UMBPY
MSVSSLPEWKQLLLERKRREEEERENREKEEEAKLANMPAWKRGIIQRRRMKQESYGDKERDGPHLVKEARSPSDAASDPDSSSLVQSGGEPPLSPDTTGLWLNEETKPYSLVLTETINPVRQNLFIRTHGGWRRGREAERAGETGHEKENEQEMDLGRERDKEIGRVNVYDIESGRGRDKDLKIERYRDSAGREMSRDKERECPKGKEKEQREEGDIDPPNPKYPHSIAPGLRTIRADNIIIIEQDRKGSDERRTRRRESEREVMDEEPENRGVKMELSEFLAGGGSVTEIRASEVLIIKPLTGMEDCRSGGLKGAGWEGNGEKGTELYKSNKDGGKICEKELEREVAQRMTIERDREKDRLQIKDASNKSDRKCNTDDGLHNERGVRVSELLSKFGEHTKKFREHPKPPSRSKSSECFIRPGRDRDTFSLDEDDGGGEEKSAGFKGVPKRSFSFSDRVICARENGIQDEKNHGRKVVERTYSERRAASWGKLVERECLEKGGTQGGLTWLSDKELVRKFREGCIKSDKQVVGHPAFQSKKRNEIDNVVGRPTPVEFASSTKATAELTEDMYGEAGFTIASVKNTEASFARRVPIKHAGWEKAMEREVKRMKEESEQRIEQARSIEKAVICARQTDLPIREKRASELRRGSDAKDTRRVSEVRDCTISVETTPQNCVITLSVDRVSPPQSVESPYRHVSTFTECSTTLLSTVAHRGTESHNSEGVPGHHTSQLALSQHTEDLINKIEKFGETANEWGSHKGTQRLTQGSKGVIKEDAEINRGNLDCMGPGEVNKDSEHPPGGHVHTQVHRKKSVQEVTTKSPKSPKHVIVVGIPPPPLEIHIPTTVFYGVGEAIEKKRTSLRTDEEDESCEGEGKTGVLRRDSWRIGKPSSRIESLRETISQREDKLKNIEGAATMGADDMPEVKGKAVTRWARRSSSLDRLEEGENKSQMEQKRQRQEGSAPQTIPTQEVCMSKAGPQLPVSHLFSQAVTEEEENFAVSKVTSFSVKTIESEEDLAKDVEDLVCDSSGQRKQDTGCGEQGEDKPSEEEYKWHYLPTSRSPSPSHSLSPSPPHPHLLAEMSRIYNLKTVGSRTAVCMGEKTVDRPIPSSNSKPQFTIRSASGGQQVKRGTTITITPRKPVGVAAMEAVVVSSGPPEKTSAQAQMPVLTDAVETGKKRYPTAEEIEVIGGYQNLDKSCLIKSPKGNPKAVKVCFDEAKLEQVCEYPSETSLLASTPYPSLSGQEKANEEEVQEEEDEEERGAFVSRSRNVGAAAGLRVLRVDESCHR